MFRKPSKHPVFINPDIIDTVIEWVDYSRNSKLPKNSLQISSASRKNEYITREVQSDCRPFANSPWKIRPLAIINFKTANKSNLQFLVAKEDEVVWTTIEENSQLPIDAYVITDGPVVGTNTFVGYRPDVGVGQIVVQDGTLKFYSEKGTVFNPPFNILCYNWYEEYQFDK